MSLAVYLTKHLKPANMYFAEQQWYHVYNRGNNRQPIFYSEENYHYFLKKMRKHLLPHCDMIAWCLMPNHFHWLVKVKEVPQDTRQTTRSGPTSGSKPEFPEISLLNRSIATLLSSYTKGVNNRQSRSGSLFQQKTKAKLLTDSDYNYPLSCFHYIHQNPLRGGLVTQSEDWPYSSYPDYAGLRNGTLVSKSLAFDAFKIKDENDFINKSVSAINPDRIEQLY